MSDKHSHDRHKWHRVHSLRPERGWSVGVKLLMLTLPLLTAAVAVAMWAVQMRISANLEENLVQRARSLHTQIMADRQYYASVIVPRVEALGGSLGEDYRQVHGRFPLPATFVREVSEITAKVREGYTANLISPWAINPDKGVKDQFQRDAFAYLMEHPTGQFVASDTVEGGAVVMRVLLGDRASTQSCVNCHNAHPKSPKHNFKLNDLMGGLEIVIPADQYLNETRQDLARALAGGVSLCLLIAGIVVLGTRWAVSQPLARLTEKVQAVAGSGEGRVAQADAVPFGDEVVQLEKTFENMLEDIQKEKIKFHRVVESAPNAILLVNQQGTITLVNAQAERLFGYAREDLLGQPIEALVPSRFRGAHPGHRAAFFADPKTRAMGAGRDLYGLHKDGGEIPIEIGLNPIETEEGPLVLASIVDITARKRAEAILRETQQAADRANQAKSEFLSRMSHELRTPLNAILGFAQLLEMDPLTPDQRESIARILHGGRHLLNLINEVLDISRIEAGHLRLSLEPVPLQETVREALDLIRPLADLRHITVRSDVGQAEGLHVKADRQRLRQVVLNLLSNAVKYNRESGSVTVTSTLTADGYAQVAVTDTGPGISSEKLARLFMPFDRLGAEQTGIEGTGLGLSLSKHLVEAMGGRLGVDSVVGQGSTFWVEMTVVPPPTGETALSHPAAPARSSTRHLLLYIEDNLSNLELIQKLLAARPEIKLLSAMQGRLGLDLARHHKPDLILLDLHLPDLGGEAVLLQLKAEPALRAIPVIILSADASQGQIERLRASGAHAYLTKPLNLKQLLALLSETLA